jgi:NAD(P)-dependent dehydrogenase (short-subunit alcohol dehydrogenase family)
MRFSEKTVLVTGAASGIGRATAELIAREDAQGLVLVDLDAGALNGLDFDCRAQRLKGDVSDEAFWASADLGELDHAVINAGIAVAGPIEDLSFSDWRRVLSVNLDGAFLTLRAALRAMRDGGSIVLVASVAGIKAEPGIAAYAASKAAVIQLGRVAAKEAAARNIRVNVIAPGGVETAIWDQVPMFADRAKQVGRDAAFAEMAAMATPLKRYAKAEEIAGQIAFLLSDACKTVTGTVFVSDGGYTL